MTQTKMPEPVAWRNWSALTGKCSLSFDCHSELASDALITTTQAEAYADARVREALEAAAAVAEERSAVLPHYSDFIRGYANGRKGAASAIRALIPPLPGPVEPSKENT